MSIDQSEDVKHIHPDMNLKTQDIPKAPKLFIPDGKGDRQRIELATVVDIEKMLLERQRPVNYAEILGGNRMIFIGESHLNNEEQEHIVRHAKDLKTAGITHYAVETIIPDSDEFDRLNKGKETDFSTVKVPQGELKKPYHIKAWRAMAKEGITVVPIDIDQRILDEIGLEGFDKMEEREQFLTDQLKKLLQDDNARIAIQIGYAHTYKERSLWHGRDLPSTAKRLINEGIPIICTTLVTSSDIQLPEGFQSAVYGGSLQNTEFMIDMSPYHIETIFKGTIEPDYIIHLPDSNPKKEDN